MHAAEKALRKACHKLATWHPESCRLQIAEDGFILQLHGDSEFVPAIGVMGDQIVGALDSFDAFLDVAGYECQIEKVLFDVTRSQFVVDAGWSGKYWLKDQGKENFTVDTIGNRMPAKITAMCLVFIAAIERESRRRTKNAVKKFLKGSVSILRKK